MELLRDEDIDSATLAGKRVAILGYGNPVSYTHLTLPTICSV